MSKQIDVSKAKDWDKQEAADNLRYLQDRGRWAEANKVREALGLELLDVPTGGDTTLDPNPQATSVTGTNDTPEALGTDPTNGDPTAVGPHGPNSDQFDGAAASGGKKKKAKSE